MCKVFTVSRFGYFWSSYICVKWQKGDDGQQSSVLVFFSRSLSALPTAHCTNIRKMPLEWSRCKIVTSIYLHAILRHMQKMVSKFLYLSSSKAKWQESFKWRIRLQFLIHSSSLGRSFNFELFLFATMVF